MKFSMLSTFVLVVLTLVFRPVSAQQSTNYQQQYLNAKALFNEGQYNLAMGAFKPITQNGENNPFSAYASYFYALCAYYQGYLPLARDMFLQLERNYPSWKNIHEVHYWLGRVYFETGDYDKALTALGKVKERALHAGIDKIKSHYFKNIPDVNTLKELYKDNPNDRVLGELLADRIAAQPFSQQDRGLLEGLIERFKLDKDDFAVADIPMTEMKERYTVAVLLPFMEDRLTPSLGKKRYQFVLDLYEGIKMAVKDLSEKGVHIELRAFDTKKSEEETRKVLANESFGQVDLIIGPLYPGPSKIALDFSIRNKVNIVNPLSFNSEIISQSPFSFLYKPSNETIGKRAATFASRYLSGRKGSIVLYALNSKADSIRAAHYREEAIAQGTDIMLMKRFKPTDTRGIIRFFETLHQNRLKDGEGKPIMASQVGSVFVASQHRVFAANVVSAMDVQQRDRVLIAPYEWLDFRFVDFDIYDRLEALLVAPDYLDMSKENYRQVRDRYIAKYSYVPGKRVFIGYDMMMFFGESLSEYGRYFQHGLQRAGFSEGYLKLGYDYTGANDNQIVPMIVFKDGEVDVNDLSGSNK